MSIIDPSDTNRRSVFKSIETFYNAARPHLTLGHKSPNQHEADHAPALAAQINSRPVSETTGLSQQAYQVMRAIVAQGPP